MEGCRSLTNKLEGCIQIEPHGTKFKIYYWSKKSKHRKKAILYEPQIKNSRSKLYQALFTEDDVDFEIFIDNSALKNRSVQVELGMGASKLVKIPYMVYPKSTFLLQSFESFGRKFHFISQPQIEQGFLERVGFTNQRENVDYNSIIPGQIQFNVSYSLPIEGGEDETTKTVSNLHFLPGGTGSAPGKTNGNQDIGVPVHLSEQEEEEDEIVDENENWESPLAMTRGERGLICFGRNCSQEIPVGLEFCADETILVEPFVIQMIFINRNNHFD